MFGVLAASIWFFFWIYIGIYTWYLYFVLCMISEINPAFLRGSFLHFKWQRSLFILKVVFFICNYILIYSSIFKNLFRRDIGCLIRIDQLFHYLKNNKKQLTNKTKRDLIGAIFLEYSRVPNKSFHSLIFSKHFPLLPPPPPRSC